MQDAIPHKPSTEITSVVLLTVLLKIQQSNSTWQICDSSDETEGPRCVFSRDFHCLHYSWMVLSEDWTWLTRRNGCMEMSVAGLFDFFGVFLLNTVNELLQLNNTERDRGGKQSAITMGRWEAWRTYQTVHFCRCLTEPVIIIGTKVINMLTYVEKPCWSKSWWRHA